MSTLTLEKIIEPAAVIDGIRYFDSQGAILLGLAISDFGRDYEVNIPVPGDSFGRMEKINKVIESIYAGKLTPDAESLERLETIQQLADGVSLQILENDGGAFSYLDARHPEAETIFDPRRELTVPESVVGRLVSKHFSGARKILQRRLFSDEFLGEVGGKLNGTDLRFFSQSYKSPRGYYPNETGTYFYNFLDNEKRLVTWRTGKALEFQRNRIYTVIAGAVKAHDRYPGYPNRTVLVRAKFYDTETNDKVA